MHNILFSFRVNNLRANLWLHSNYASENSTKIYFASNMYFYKWRDVSNIKPHPPIVDTENQSRGQYLKILRQASQS